MPVSSEFDDALSIPGARGHRLTLKLVRDKDGNRALVFDPDTWAVFEQAAAKSGESPHKLIIDAVAGSMGPIVSERVLQGEVSGVNPEDRKERQKSNPALSYEGARGSFPVVAMIFISLVVLYMCSTVTRNWCRTATGTLADYLCSSSGRYHPYHDPLNPSNSH